MAKITRREAIQTVIGGSSVATLVCQGSDVKAAVTHTWNTGKRAGLSPMVMRIHDIPNEHRRWDTLGSALFELHTLFRSERVSDNARTLRVNQRGETPVEFVDNDYRNRTNLAKHNWGNNPNMLLWWQLLILRSERNFPVINVRPFFERTDVWARAHVGTVLTRFLEGRNAGSDWELTGEFDIQVNLWKLGGEQGAITTWANMWSAVLAHEMLHNLGHKHHPNEYVDGRQINSFHRAIYCQGGYDGRQNVPGFR